jgi:hypothetical protein
LFWLRYNITCGWHRAEGVSRDFNIVIDGRHNSMFRQIIPSVTSKLFFWYIFLKALGKNKYQKVYIFKSALKQIWKYHWFKSL